MEKENKMENKENDTPEELIGVEEPTFEETGDKIIEEILNRRKVKNDRISERSRKNPK